jgi:hypothetical protein
MELLRHRRGEGGHAACACGEDLLRGTQWRPSATDKGCADACDGMESGANTHLGSRGMHRSLWLLLLVCVRKPSTTKCRLEAMLCPPGGLDGHDAWLILVSEVLSDDLCGGHSVSGSIFRSSWRSTTSLISLLERARVGNGWARRLKFGQKRPRRPMSRGEDQAFGRPADERETKLSIEIPNQTKRNFCRLGRLKTRPEQSPPH